MNKERAQKNFSYWKNLVNLPPTFPDLKPLTAEEMLDLAVIEGEDERKIINSLYSKPLTMVIVPDGGGLSTLYRYIFEKCKKESTTRESIPVTVDLNDIDDPITSEYLEQTIKTQVIGSLVSQDWTSLPEEHYYPCINYNESIDFQVYRAEALDFLFGKRKKAWSSVKKNFPSLKQPLGIFLNDLLENMRLQTLIFFHIPKSKADEEPLLALSSALKIIHEINAFMPAAIREVYFINPGTSSDLNREYKRNYNIVNHPRVTGAQIFAMLNKRFRPTLPGPMGSQERIDLSAVFSEDFIHLAKPKVSGIKDVINSVNHMLLEKLDCPRKDVLYRLAPPPELLEKLKISEDDDEDTTTGPIKFKRRRRS